MSHTKQDKLIVMVTIVTLLSAGCRHSAIDELPAVCRSPNPDLQAGLALTPQGGGNCIAFGCVRYSIGGYPDFYISIMVVDGSRLARLTVPDAYDLDPDWSPDGKRIAFTSNRGKGGMDIYIMDADGSNRIRLTDFSGNDQQPAWSPDGGRIAFTSARIDKGEREADNDIYVMDIDGSHLARLTDDPDNDWDPDWSPDGTRIVFVSDRGSGPAVNGVRYLDGEIYVMNADGSNLVRLTDNQIHEHEPAWSPDGKRIAFTVRESAVLPSQIYVMNVDGSNRTQLTKCRNGCSEPAWSPDGTQIAFAFFIDDEEEGHDVIYVMAADGTNPRQLTNDQVGGNHPAWQP